jgi:hypothetical protein
MPLPISLPQVEEHDSWSAREWTDPPKQFRPMIRWRWPGGNVTDEGITAELTLRDELGFGGIEIQSFTFGLPGEEARVPAVPTVGSPSFVLGSTTHRRRHSSAACEST